MQRALVTGGAGFIGSHLVTALLKLQLEVHVMDNLSFSQARSVHPRATLHVQDITKLDTISLLAQIKPDIIFHLAAQADVQASITSPYHDCDTNIIGTLNMLEYCRQYAPNTKLIFSSTSGVYGDLQKPAIDEVDPVNPISFYALSKLTAERYIEMYHMFYGIPYTILRFANVYGPGQTIKGEGGVIAIFMNKLFHSAPLLINGDGEQTRDFIYVADVAQALISVMEHGEAHTFHVSTGTTTSINDVARFANKLHVRQGNVPVPILYKPAKAGDIRHSCLNNTLIQKHLPWKPTHNIESGLALTYNSFI